LNAEGRRREPPIAELCANLIWLKAAREASGLNTAHAVLAPGVAPPGLRKTRNRNLFGHRVQLFTLLGIAVRIDLSWLLLAVLVCWTLADGVFPYQTPGLGREIYWQMAVAGAAGLFASIVFHEMAHALVARRYGISIRGITLFIFGGVAEMDSEPRSARGELLMALAGPVASVTLAALLFALSGLVQQKVPEAVTGVLVYLAIINGVLAVFNLIPAFPLDGGRVLRAILWSWRGDIVWATRMAAGAGNLFGSMLIVLGVIGIITGDFVGGMWRFLIGMFLRGAAEASYRQIVAQRTFSGTSVAQVMTADPVAVSPDLSVAEFIENFVYRYHHRVFPVVRQRSLIGQVGTREAAAVDRALWPVTSVEQIALACPEDEIVAPDVDALVALAQIQRTGQGRLFVVRNGELIGVVTLRDLLEVMSARLELEAGRGAADVAQRGVLQARAGRPGGAAW